MVKFSQQDEGMILDIFVRALSEVVVPILEDHGEKLEEHGKMLEELTDKVDTHTASLMELEKLPVLIGEIYQEVKGTRGKLENHERRITKLESKIVQS